MQPDIYASRSSFFTVSKVGMLFLPMSQHSWDILSLRFQEALFVFLS